MGAHSPCKLRGQTLHVQCLETAKPVHKMGDRAGWRTIETQPSVDWYPLQVWKMRCEQQQFRRVQVFLLEVVTSQSDNLSGVSPR